MDKKVNLYNNLGKDIFNKFVSPTSVRCGLTLGDKR